MTWIAETAITAIREWDAQNHDAPDADLWGDLLYGMDGVDHDATSDDLSEIAFQDGSRVVSTYGEWRTWVPGDLVIN